MLKEDGLQCSTNCTDVHVASVKYIEELNCADVHVASVKYIEELNFECIIFMFE